MKEQDGRYYQECRVVMLATEKETNIIYRENDDILIKKHAGNSALTETDRDFRNIYILSDDEIKEGDWYCYPTVKSLSIKQYSEKEHFSQQPCISLANLKAIKIIATTDNLSWIEHDSTVPYPKGSQHFVPKPSNSFIKKYIEEYNAGRQITNVLVEYVKHPIENYWYLHTDSDYEITITKLKDSYSREEVRDLFMEFTKTLTTLGLHKTENWIKDNL